MSSDSRPCPTFRELLVQRGERVRIVCDLDERLRAGSEGRVFGFVRRSEGDALAVAFDCGPSRVVAASELELAERPPCVAAGQDPLPPAA